MNEASMAVEGSFPSEQTWALLKPAERFNFRVLHTIFESNILRTTSNFLCDQVGRRVVQAGTFRMLGDSGTENFAKIDPSKGVLLVANHRTYYDLFIIMARLIRRRGHKHQLCFPVRAPFFYDHPAGLAVNFTMSYGTMYPPVLRDPKRSAWNVWAIDRICDLLRQPRTLVGFHPEGTRNKSADSLKLLPAKRGCSEIIYRSRPNVVPVFMEGLPESIAGIYHRNWNPFGAGEARAHMCMGPPLDFSEEFERPADKETYRMIGEKVMAALLDLGHAVAKERS